MRGRRKLIGKLVRGSGELHGRIDLATLMEFEKITPGTRICTCLDFDCALNADGLTWTGGEHLVSATPGTDDSVHMHYYPNRETGHILILTITSSPAA